MYGKQIEHWSGFDLSAQARLRVGLNLQGGVSTGQTLTDNCEILAKLPENVGSTSTQFCHTQTPWLTQVKFGGSYTLPWGVQVSGTLQSFQGPILNANATFTNAQIAPSLQRNLSTGTTATVALVQPNTLYGKRLNQVDARLAKIFKLDKAKTKAPARSLVSIDDVGVATAFLAHDAARLITGETLYIDGGYHIMD